MGVERKAAGAANDELRVLTVSQIAMRMGKKYDATLAMLKRLDADCHGMLLKNLSPRAKVPRYGVTIAALRRVAPEWFGDDSAPPAWRDRVAALERGLERSVILANVLSSRVVALEMVVAGMRMAS